MNAVADTLSETMRLDFDLACRDVLEAEAACGRTTARSPARAWRRAAPRWTPSWTCGTRPEPAVGPAARGDHRAGRRLLAGSPLGRAVFDRVAELLGDDRGCAVTVSKSQVAFRRRRAFAWLCPAAG